MTNWSGWTHQPRLPLRIVPNDFGYSTVLDADGYPMARGSRELCEEAVERMTKELGGALPVTRRRLRKTEEPPVTRRRFGKVNRRSS